MHEAIETVPKLYGNFLKTLNEVESKDGQKRFDRQKLNEGYQAYKAAIKIIKDNSNFMQDLTNIRNSVAAHHLDKKGSLQSLVDWYMIKRKEMDSHPEASTLLYYAAIVAGALYPLAQ